MQILRVQKVHIMIMISTTTGSLDSKLVVIMWSRTVILRIVDHTSHRTHRFRHHPASPLHLLIFQKQTLLFLLFHLPLHGWLDADHHQHAVGMEDVKIMCVYATVFTTVHNVSMRTVPEIARFKERVTERRANVRVITRITDAIVVLFYITAHVNMEHAIN